MSGNIPSSNILLNILAKGNASGVATIAINRPGKPQCDVFDFFISLHSFATSMGEVLIFVRSVNISSFGVMPVSLLLQLSVDGGRGIRKRSEERAINIQAAEDKTRTGLISIWSRFRRRGGGLTKTRRTRG